MRKPPTATLKDVPATVPTRANVVVHERRYELITPLFGGGVKAGETDPITVINGKSVRGQLRFWWRAVRGGQFNGDPQLMRAAEKMIWGAASTEEEKLPSLVQTVVRVDPGSQPVLYRQLPNELKYGAFPLQQHNGSVSRGVRFTLFVEIKHDLVRCPDMTFEQLQVEVEAALWAWETFGGIGARIRRGFGALKLASWTRNGVNQAIRWDATDFDSAFDILEAGFDEYLVDDCFPPHVPHLTFDTRIRLHTRHRNGEAAQKDLLGALKQFRQGYRNPPTRPLQPGQTPPPGRSKWPEPETIRQITRQRLVAGIRSATDFGHPPIPAYTGQQLVPRAQFGLPIVFEFNPDDRHPRAADRDPRKTVLQMSTPNHNEAIQRWASPLILRPLAAGPNLFFGMAVYLEGSKPLFPVALYEANAEVLIQSGLSMDLSPAQARAIASLTNAPPVTIRNANGTNYIDIVEDFLESL